MLALLMIASCSEVTPPSAKEYFANTPPPQKQEFRWSNGRSPKTLDPARVSAAPETDIVRALYEGLTELDPKTLDEMPAAAESWAASDNNKVWTFRLRSDAKWSDGSALSSDDFSRSWLRAISLGKESPHRALFSNIAGVGAAAAVKEPDENVRSSVPALNALSAEQDSLLLPNDAPHIAATPPKKKIPDIGIESPDERTLVVTLTEPDAEFAKLVAHPVFRPVFNNDAKLKDNGISQETVVNGAFTIAEVKPEGLVLERSAHYWNREAVKLERVVFVPAESGDKALEAYREGRVDVITNTEFSPLALKLLTSYGDFRRTTFAAINFYEVNHELPAFRDRRVREALAISIERERLTEGELEGTTQPALTLLPFGAASRTSIVQDREKARELMELAGYPDGKSFPVIRLTVNRNDTQIRIARSVADMWKRNLNIDTDIQIKEPSEIEPIREKRDFELIRRGVVLSTPDAYVGLRTIFGSAYTPAVPFKEDDDFEDTMPDSGPNANSATNDARPNTTANQELPTALGPITNENDALFELTAIPLYFPLSYSLVKPFVIGFDPNSLDSPFLQRVEIDAEWSTARNGS